MHIVFSLGLGTQANRRYRFGEVPKDPTMRVFQLEPSAVRNVESWNSTRMTNSPHNRKRAGNVRRRLQCDGTRLSVKATRCANYDLNKGSKEFIYIIAEFSVVELLTSIILFDMTVLNN